MQSRGGLQAQTETDKTHHRLLCLETQEQSGNFSQFFRYVQLLCLLYYVNRYNQNLRNTRYCSNAACDLKILKSQAAAYFLRF